MRILIVSSYLPFPLYSGGHIRLYNLIKQLSEKHDITLICEKRDNQTDADVAMVSDICEKVITVKRNKQWSLQNVLKTGFSTQPFLTVGHTSDEFKQTIMDELVRENYDLIHVETFYVMQNLPKTQIPVVLVEHNIEYKVYERYAKLANPLLKKLYSIDILKLKKAEKDAWAKANKLVAVSQLEKNQMEREDVEVVANGVDTDNFIFRNWQNIPTEKKVLFIGDFKWIQNKDALEFILKEIWPNVLNSLKKDNIQEQIKLWIVGRNIPDYLKQLGKGLDNVVFDENNKDETAQIFRQSFLLLAPLRAAGGSSYKILEAMSSGVAVVTTNLSVESLEAKADVHVLTAESGLSFAENILELYKNHSLYKKITLNARKLTEEKYDWKIIAEKLNEVYLS